MTTPLAINRRPSPMPPVRDAAGRTVQYDWCRCADLNALIDAKGQRTTWTRDVHGRFTTETRADGTTTTSYTYQPLTGRLATVTDPKAQVTTYTYHLDDSLASTGFTNETIATADLSHTYDTQYARPATMVDGNGPPPTPTKPPARRVPGSSRASTVR